MEFKDNFSEQATIYAEYRPCYPADLFQYLAGLVNTHSLAIDCGTGNGQTAVSLANHFRRIFALDPSRRQLLNARKGAHIFYLQSTAEMIPLRSAIADLITISQAVHWVNFNRFFQEVSRLLRDDGLIAFWGYNLPKINKNIDHILLELYRDVLGNYWHKERKFIDAEYRTIPFPFDEIEIPLFQMKTEWCLEHFLGYIKTWSAVQNYFVAHGKNPVSLVEERIAEAWGDVPVRLVHWPLFIRAGKKSATA